MVVWIVVWMAVWMAVGLHGGVDILRIGIGRAIRSFVTWQRDSGFCFEQSGYPSQNDSLRPAQNLSPI
jgi:hypothetical protein